MSSCLPIVEQLRQLLGTMGPTRLRSVRLLCHTPDFEAGEDHVAGPVLHHLPVSNSWTPPFGITATGVRAP